MPIIHFLQKQSTIKLWLTATIVSIAMSEIITSVMGLILVGKITYDYLLTGLVASFLVAGFVTAALVYFLRQLQESTRHLQRITENLNKSEEIARQAIIASQSALWDLDLTTWNVYLSDGWSPFLSGQEQPTFTTLKKLYDLVPPEEQAMLNTAIVAAMKGVNNSIYKVTHRVKKLDGNYIWVLSEGKVTERDHNGRALRMTGINRDITDIKMAENIITSQIEQIMQANTELLDANKKLKQTQNQLFQAEKMASIGQLAAGVAHEINNPIGYVNSNLGTLKKYLHDIFALLDKYDGAVNLINDHPHDLEALRDFKKLIRLDHLREDSKAIILESQEGLDHVKQIVLDLKDFSHTGSEDTWKSSDILQILESSLNMVSNELKYKCEIRKEYSPLPKVFCLPLRLNQVFMNLLLNAAQAIEARGIITIRTGYEADQIWIEIADTGHGIDPKDMTRIFDPFFTTKPVGKGTGLGLSLSYGIVEKHHGRIEVHSEIGKGSSFRVWLPVKQSSNYALATH